MADKSEQKPDGYQDLLASLASTSNPAGGFRNPGTANYQTYPFHLLNSTQARSSQSPQLKPQSTQHESFSGYNQRIPGTINPNVTAARSSVQSPPNQSAEDRTANLLNLLNFGQATPSRGPTVPQLRSHTGADEQSKNQLSLESAKPQHAHVRGVSASDLVATFIGLPSRPTSRETAGNPGAPPAVNPQDFLLQLLNRPRNANEPTPSSPIPPTEPHSAMKDPLVQDATMEIIEKISRDLADTSMDKAQQAQAVNTTQGNHNRHESPIRVFGSSDIKDTTPFEPQVISKVEPAKEPSMFTYVNPFEQLAASSPRNAKARSGNATPQKGLTQKGLSKPGHLAGHADSSKRKTNDPTPARSSSATRRKLTQDGREVLESIETSDKGPVDRNLSRKGVLAGLGAPTTNPETVAEALNEVGAQVSKQVDHALAQASNAKGDTPIKHEEINNEQDAALDALEEGLHRAAAEVKADLEKDENKGALEQTLPQDMAEVVKEIINEAAEGDVDGVRGSTEDEKAFVDANAATAIAVYNFPMRPFVCIDIKQDHLPTQQLREDVVIQIARLKKEFDQIDRTLATASSKFILYAMPKAGGLRIIRQDDGIDRQVFKETHDRVFNVALSTTAPGSSLSEVQTFIATAVSGNVYWATISQPGSDIIGEANIESNVLVLPPVPLQDENTSGGQLKTRAKKSSRHPEYFAIGRGKSIQIVFPNHARSSAFVSSDAVVETTGYFSDRSLKINTGKAGKDFTFSEDDTVITTLDKAGRLRFWDIRDLVHESNGTASKIAPIELSSPILSFSTAVANEKSWPTSVLFVDKIRPYNKGTALRYIIVGMKQNHTLQLWDLGLGKVVQELSFPHENESDAVCSVCFHPGSGMIVVGHPTRNSIYLIHLSSPKYNLQGMSQATYVKRLAAKDPNIRIPDATAIMSGMREYSFSAKGNLRSVDLLPISSDSLKGANSEEEPSLFELYVMHSKGVTCLSMNKEDLGWSQDTKVLSPFDAELLKVIEVRALREAQPTVMSEMSSINGDSQQGLGTQSEQAQNDDKKESSKASTKARKAKLPKSIDAAANGTSSTLETPATRGTSNDVERAGNVPRRNAGSLGSEPGPISPLNQALPGSYAAPSQTTPLPDPYGSAKSGKEAKKSTLSESEVVDAPEANLDTEQRQSHGGSAAAEPNPSGVSGDFLNKELKKLEQVVSAEFTNVLGKELGGLYRRIDADRRVQDAAGAAKQDAMLRLVSSTLTENVDKALARIINTNIQQVVLPYLTEAMMTTLNDKLPGLITQQLLHTLPAQLKLALPEAVSKAIQTPDVLRVLADQVTAKISNQVEKQFVTVLQQTIAPAFQNLAVGAAQKMNAETERRVAEQLQQVAVTHREDAAKIDRLENAVIQMTHTLHAMADAQTAFQNEFLATRRENTRDTPGGSAAGQPPEDQLALTASDDVSITPEEQTLRDVIAQFLSGKWEEATSQWLQSGHQEYIFDRFFSLANPAYIKKCIPLLILSAAATVTTSFDRFPDERLNWLQAILDAINPTDPEVVGVAPQLMHVLCQRVQGFYMDLAENDRGNPIIHRLPALARQAQELAAAADWNLKA